MFQRDYTKVLSLPIEDIPRITKIALGANIGLTKSENAALAIDGGQTLG